MSFIFHMYANKLESSKEVDNLSEKYKLSGLTSVQSWKESLSR